MSSVIRIGKRMKVPGDLATHDPRDSNLADSNKSNLTIFLTFSFILHLQHNKIAKCNGVIFFILFVVSKSSMVLKQT